MGGTSVNVETCPCEKGAPDCRWGDEGGWEGRRLQKIRKKSNEKQTSEKLGIIR